MTLCGILTGMETPLSIHQTYFRHLRIQGVYLGTEQEYREMIELLANKSITVPIAARHSLATSKQALQAFGKNSHLGKVIIEPA
jgi:D-arabinose 1-dehydrogenase-like Zn-dependent alcohol dehydrogenase